MISIINISFVRLTIPENNDLRIRLGQANTMDQFRTIVKEIQEIYEPYNLGTKSWGNCTEPDTQNLLLPPWLCQPYVRFTAENVEKTDEGSDDNAKTKRVYEDAEGNVISRKKMKRLRRIQRRPLRNFEIPDRNVEICSGCENPKVVLSFSYFLLII